MAKFVHLHVHSHYSLLDGLGKIDQLIARAKELGMTSLALTDHGNMHGAIEFYTKCKKADIQPIIGVESYLARRGMADRVPKIDSRPHHQLLLAKNDEGYHNLLKLVSEAHVNGMYYKPRIDLDLLRKHHRGLIGTSSCLAGMIPEAITAGDPERAFELAKQFADWFDGEFYLEIQHHPELPEQVKVNKVLKQIAKELKLDLIATGDVHYVRPEDRDAHEILLAVNTGKDLASEDRMSLGDINLAMEGEEYFLQAFSDVPEAIDNTAKVAAKVKLELQLGQNILPIFVVPKGKTEISYLDELCRAGFAERYPNPTPEIKERLEFELSTIEKTGFVAYFLIVADFVNWAKDQGIYVGPGRGSAAGSIVAYCLKITDLDPIPYGFLFERFLNPDRISMPDIDMDFADDDRDKVIGYVRQKYGEDHVAGIATFGTMMGRAAVRDVGRVLGMPYGEVDEIAKLVPQPVQGRHVPLKQGVQEVAELKQKYDADPRIKKLIDFAIQLEGTVRHTSQHACAFVICREPTTNYAPVQPAQRGREGLLTQYSMKPIEEIGLLKMDFLGLSNLTIMRNAVRIIHKVYDTKININQLPLDDKKTFALLARGETTGVFQLESDGMQRYIKELKPNKFEDIMVMVALYRPGPMQFIPTYIARKFGREEVEFAHPSLKNSLGETYGIPVYQEQVMQASKDIAGFTGGEADILRKAMGKKIASLMAQMKTKFIDGCKTHSNVDAELAKKIFKQFEDFAAYGFNKSHAGCYGLISYQTAYLKAHYPAAFFAALLTSNADNLDKVAIEIAEAGKMGIEIKPPNVNESYAEFGVVKKELEVRSEKLEEPKQGKASNFQLPTSNCTEYIRFGLAAIKNVGQGVSEKIVEERKANGPYLTLSDFLYRLGPTALNRKSLESLAMSGGLDEFGERNQIVQSLDMITRFLGAGKAQTNQIDLFGADQSTSLLKELVLPEVTPASKPTILQWERDLLGIYLTGHPLKALESILPRLTTPISSVTADKVNTNQRVGGMIQELRVITTKSNEAMAFVKLLDTTAVIEVVVFPRTWETAKNFVQPDRYCIVDGRVDNRDGESKIIASRIFELHPEEGVDVIAAALGPKPSDKVMPSYRKNGGQSFNNNAPSGGSGSAPVNRAKPEPFLAISLPATTSKSRIESVKIALTNHPGPISVFLQITNGSDMKRVQTKAKVLITQELLDELKKLRVAVSHEGEVLGRLAVSS